MTTVRAFAAGDEGPLVAAWNRSLPTDPATPSWLRERVLLDPNFDPEGLRVAVVDGRLAGCAYGVRRLIPPAPSTDLEPGTGWIPFFFVTPEHRGRGLGRRLLEEALAFLAAHGRTTVEFAPYTPNYVLPGVDPERYPQARRLLEKLGFRTAPRRSPWTARWTVTSPRRRWVSCGRRGSGRGTCSALRPTGSCPS